MIPILFEDNHCLVVDKPAGLLAQGDSTGEPSVYDMAKAYLKSRYDKPGNVYVGLIHRLDRPTSGVLLLAKTSKAAGRLSEQFRDSLVEKTYLAIAEGDLPDERGEWHDFLLKSPENNTVFSVPRGTQGARAATVRYRVMDRTGRRSLIELKPDTGRSHQLRVQLASRGLPILGDFKYGSRVSIMGDHGGPRIALHASALIFKHPTRLERLTIAAPTPSDWPSGPSSTR